MTVLRSWADTATRRTIVGFVREVCDEHGPHHVPAEERIAVFDNDGTLWSEQPFVQGAFIMDRLAAMAEADPSLRGEQPWTAAHAGDADWLVSAVVKHYEGDSSDVRILLRGVLAAFADMTVEEYQREAAAFFETARHPERGCSYLDVAYRPMLELLDHLDRHGFTTYVVTGGGRDFLRPVAQRLYGVPPERIIGSGSALEIRRHDGRNMLVRSDQIGILDDGDAKPVQIWERVGRRPILAAGNANGDLPMFDFTEANPRRTLCLVVAHDDAEREVSSTRGAERALAAAGERGWTTISMRHDWTTVFASGTTA